ncbi:MAG: hypothetical protein M0C28_04920 [Candidatus Moduliflexus flocculans]|nr:hypothetical protein [Candidatus Moduliflexus flocculans]
MVGKALHRGGRDTSLARAADYCCHDHRGRRGRRLGGGDALYAGSARQERRH